MEWLDDLKRRSARAFDASARYLSRSLDPVAPAGAPLKVPKQPDLTSLSQLPSYRAISYRDVMGWDVPLVKTVLAQIAGGTFSMAGLLADDFRIHPIVAKCIDDRWAFNTIFPRHVTPSCGHVLEEDCKRNDVCRRARYVRDWLVECMPEVYPDDVLRSFHDDRLQMGQGIMGCDWEERRDGSQRFWLPRLKPWHPAQTQYLWTGDPRSVDGGQFAAVTMNKGLVTVEPGGGRWVLTQATRRQPWLKGAVYSLALDWMGDLYNFLDNLSFEERFGLGVMKYFAQVEFPRADAGGGGGQVPQSAQSIAAMGRGAVVPLRLKSDGTKMEDLELISTNGTGWECFNSTENRILRRILLFYLGQDLTSVGQPGGLGQAQAEVHKTTLWDRYGESASWIFDARRVDTVDPATGEKKTNWEPCDGVLRSQMTGWVTQFNFRDRDLAPYVWRNGTPPEDVAKREQDQDKRMGQRSTAIANLAKELPALRQQMPGVPAAQWFVKIGAIDPSELEEHPEWGQEAQKSEFTPDPVSALPSDV